MKTGFNALIAHCWLENPGQGVYKIQFNGVRQINISRNGQSTASRICTKTLGKSFFVRGRLSGSQEG